MKLICFCGRLDTVGYFNSPSYEYKFRTHNEVLGYLEFSVYSKSKNIRRVKVRAKFLAKNFAAYNWYFDWIV